MRMTERNDRERRKTIRLLCRDKKVAEIRTSGVPGGSFFSQREEGDNDFSLSPSFVFPYFVYGFYICGGILSLCFSGGFSLHLDGDAQNDQNET